MTERRAEEVLQVLYDNCCTSECEFKGKCEENCGAAINTAITDMEELQQYRAIGIVEECREAVEVKKEITEIVDRQLIAGKNNYKEVYDCFHEIVKNIQDNY